MIQRLVSTHQSLGGYFGPSQIRSPQICPNFHWGSVFWANQKPKSLNLFKFSFSCAETNHIPLVLGHLGAKVNWCKSSPEMTKPESAVPNPTEGHIFATENVWCY